jgi:HK97 family phage major capsid protein
MINEKVQELRDSLLDLNEQVQVIQAKADGEKRDLLEDEDDAINELLAKFKKTEKEIERRERIDAQTDKLMESAGRVTEPQQPEPQHITDKAAPAQSTNRPRIQIMEDKGKWGWRSFGEFAASVRPASRNGGMVDPRLVQNAPTTYSSEGVGADGGFAVPPDFRQAIMEKVMGEASLMGLTDQMQTSSNTITFPKDETTPWDASGGLQAYWDGENDQLTQSKVALKEHTLRLNKLTALIPVTEELMSDAPALDGYLRRRVPEKFDSKLNLAIVQGTGTGQPTGILNSGSLVSVAKTSSQVADTINHENLLSMWSRMYGPSRQNAVWLYHQDIEPQINSLGFATSATAVPIYMPPGGLSATPYGTLMGRPMIQTQACETLGDKGDLILVDLNQYITVTKTSGIRADTSMHLWFDYDTMAYRFIFRVAGEPWWNSAITQRDGSNTLSWAVTLDERV